MRGRVLTWTAGACMAALLGLAPAAQAATVSSTGALISVTGGVKVDTVTVAASDEETRVEDSTAPLTAQPGCTQVNAHVATCPANFDVDIAVDLRDGDDTATIDGGGTVDVTAGTGNDTVAVNHPFRVSQVHGGTGDDHLSMGSTLGGALFGEDGNDDLELTAGAAGLDGGPGDDRLVGGPGNDSLSPGPGNDVVLADNGDDYIDADDGADDISGGNGNDWLLYHGGVANVTLDDVADDGAPGEGDNVHSDVENVDARDAISTRIVGDDASNQLFCWTNCTIDGGGGDDVLAATYQASLDGGDGDDRFQLYVPYSGGGIDMHGGPGSDTVEEVLSDRSIRVSISLDDQANDGASGSQPSNVHSDVENVIGGDGPDELRGDDAANTLVGGGGDDLIQPELGADTVAGGTGYDELDYSALSTGVRVSLDWVADDGAGGASGNVLPDIEAVYGGKGDDDLRAGAAPGGLVLDGGPGNDILVGGAGDDDLRPGPGADTISGGEGEDLVDYSPAATPVVVTLDGQRNDGGPGENDLVGTDVEDVVGSTFNDVLSGGPGDDVLDGGAGDDVLDGGDGSDILLGESGNDTIAAADGAQDGIDCGDGTDSATLDAVDLAFFCERVTGRLVSLPTPTQPTPPAAPTTPATPVVVLPAPAVPSARLSKLALVRRATLVVTVGCPNTRWGACHGTLTATSTDGHARPLGHASFNVPAGKTRTLRIAVARPARQALAHRTTLHAVLRATVRGNGHSRTVVRRVTLHLG